MIQVQQTLTGIGDSLLGLVAAYSLKAEDPTRRVIYCCDERAIPWLLLFEGYDVLTAEHFPGIRTFDLGEALIAELSTGQGRTWGTVYANWCGCGSMARPKPRPLLVSRYQNYVVLCPLTASWPRREWDLKNWALLESGLRLHGLPTIVLAHDTRRLGRFTGPVLSGPAREIASIINDAALVIGVDTGLMHLAGALMVPAIVLAGPTIGRQVYGDWPTVTPIEGDGLTCYGCYHRIAKGGADTEAFISEACRTWCAALDMTSPQRVLNLALELIEKSSRAGRPILQGGQRRVHGTGEIEPWLTDTALDEIMQWDLEDKCVLEWGGGHSSLWWARRTRHVLTIEADARWAGWIQDCAVANKLSNLHVEHRPLDCGDQQYPVAPTGLRPDIVVVDGANRLECIKESLKLPRPLRLVVDNWDHPEGFATRNAILLLRDFRGHIFADSTMLDARRPWQTAIWYID